MRLVRLTTRQLMIGVAVAAVLLSGPSHPDVTREANLPGWLLAMTATNALPLVIFPLIVQLDRSRRRIAWTASAAILAAQVAFQAPANSVGFVGQLAVWGIASRARTGADLVSAIVAMTCGVAAGVACGYNPCTPIEIVLAPAVGLVVRALSRRRRGRVVLPRSSRSQDGPFAPSVGEAQVLFRLRRRDRAGENRCL